MDPDPDSDPDADPDSDPDADPDSDPDADPSIFIIGLQDENKNLILKVLLHHFSKIKSQKYCLFSIHAHYSYS